MAKISGHFRMCVHAVSRKERKNWWYQGLKDETATANRDEGADDGVH